MSNIDLALKQAGHLVGLCSATGLLEDPQPTLGGELALLRLDTESGGEKSAWQASQPGGSAVEHRQRPCPDRQRATDTAAYPRS